MRYLFAGSMSLEEFEHVISMTGLRSEGMIDSLRGHLVTGFDEGIATLGNGVSQGNFSRDLKKVEKLYGQLQKYNEIIGVSKIK